MITELASKRLVLLGGGHAHVEVLRRLAEADPPSADSPSAGRPAVTLISPEENHYYSGMGPGLVGMRYRPEDLAFPIRRLCARAGVRFVQGSAGRIDCDRRRVELADGSSLPFDVLSCNVGSVVDCSRISCGPEAITVKPIRNLLVGQRRTERLLSLGPVRLAVVGGGPAAFEIAGNAGRMLRTVATVLPHPESANAARSSVTLIPGRRPLHGFPERAKKLVFAELAAGGVSVGPHAYVVAVEGGEVVCEDGSAVPADLAFIATGVQAPRLFADSALPVAGGGELLVDGHLESVGCAGVFGAGDCIQPAVGALEKVGVYAVRQTPVLFENLIARLGGRPLSAFDGSGRYLLLFNMGTPRGVFVRGGIALRGRWAMSMKDRIDRRFARPYSPTTVG